MAFIYKAEPRDVLSRVVEMCLEISEQYNADVTFEFNGRSRTIRRPLTKGQRVAAILEDYEVT